MWTAKAHDGSEQRVLVIVTTIPLEPDQKGYKKSLVERLSRAAREHLASSNEAASYMLVHRLRDWIPPRLEPLAGFSRSAAVGCAIKWRFSGKSVVIDCRLARDRGRRGVPAAAGGINLGETPWRT